MRLQNFFSAVLLATATGCSLGPSEPVVPDAGSPYTDLPASTTTVSGIVHDPEAFFFVMAQWPESPPDDPRGPPPPALLNGVPYLMFSSMEASIELVSTEGTVGASGGSAPTGSWQVTGLPTSSTSMYHMRATPPPQGVVLGGAVPFPPPVPLPEGATYYPTATLRPIVPSATLCQLQVATLVGDAGALSAVAQTLSSQGPQTTVADLLDPTKTGGVLLFWVYAPSRVFDLFVIPGGGVAVAPPAIPGAQLFALDWAPPEANIPGQSRLGYMANPEPGAVSSIGYYALVLPPGEPQGPVMLELTDTVTSSPDDPPNPFGPRPWGVPPVVEEVRPGQVSFARVHAFPGGEPPPENPDAEPVPFPDFNSICLPQGPPPEE